MRRRVFIQNSGKATVLAAIGLSACKDEDIEPDLRESLVIDLSIAPFDQLLEEGNWLLHPTENIILVNFEGTIRAFTSVCTHSQCSRDWVFGTSQATCTCHGSRFNWEGQVVGGPAETDLELFDAQQNGNELTISQNRTS